MSRCAATTAKGTHCKNKALDDSEFCRVHFKSAPVVKHEDSSDDDDHCDHSDHSDHDDNTSNSTSSRSRATTSKATSKDTPPPSMTYNTLYVPLPYNSHKKTSNKNTSNKKKTDDGQVVRNMTEKGAIHKAMLLYYHDNKDDITLIDDVKDRLSRVGLLHNKTVTVNGIPMEVPNIPWLVVKLATDFNFIHHISQDVRNRYINLAKQQHLAKYSKE